MVKKLRKIVEVLDIASKGTGEYEVNNIKFTLHVTNNNIGSNLWTYNIDGIDFVYDVNNKLQYFSGEIGRVKKLYKKLCKN